MGQSEFPKPTRLLWPSLHEEYNLVQRCAFVYKWIYSIRASTESYNVLVVCTVDSLRLRAILYALETKWPVTGGWRVSGSWTVSYM